MDEKVKYKIIDKDTKIKDVIPERYELDVVTEFATKEGDDDRCIRIYVRCNEFDYYLKKYKDASHVLSKDKYFYKEWEVAEILGLLWFIIKARGGSVIAFTKLLQWIHEYIDHVAKDSFLVRIYNILPQEFCDRIKQL